MALEIIIPPNSPAFSERVELEGVFYRVTFRWNTRAAAWFLDVATPDGVLLAGGVAIRVGVPLLGHLRARGDLPPGDLIAIDTADQGRDPGLDELGQRVKLLYLTQADIEESARG